MDRATLTVEGEAFEAIATGPEGGPVAIFLHGFPDVPATWGPVMERFAKRGYRCVAPYMRGYSPSTTEGPFDLDRLGRDVLGFAGELSPRRPVFVLGHDWGAAATWFAAMKAPQRIAAALTVAVPHPMLFMRGLARPAQLVRSRYMFALQLRSIDRAGIEKLWRRWSPGYTPPEGYLDEVAETIARSGDAPIAYYRAMRRPKRLVWLRFVDRERATVRTPMLYLHGLDDGCIGTEVVRSQEKLVDAPHRIELLCAGHFVPLEVPDAVAERALRFFETYAPAAAPRFGSRSVR